VATTRVISVVGKKNAGKTTLVVALADAFTRRGRKVATIKHGHHPALVDREGTDTWRHFTEGKAERVLIDAPGQRVLFERTAADGEPLALVRRFMRDMDIVLIEGFKAHPLPKIEVHRISQHPAPLYERDGPEAHLWVAIMTDDPDFRAPVPVFHFSDTSWLVTLSALAWKHAAVLDD